jgi:RAP1 GTPase activating protein 1
LNLSESDDSSLNSIDLDTGGVYNGDSDTGLESMSSAETPHKPISCSFCMDGNTQQEVCPEAASAVEVAVARQLESLRQEVTRLKCDKLDLLRQNVVSLGSFSHTGGGVGGGGGGGSPASTSADLPSST